MLSFVYLIGGFVPIQPPSAPTENEPEPFPFVGTGEVLVYTPRGHAARGVAVQGQWVSLPAESSFPKPDMHHIVAVAHQGQIWALGGHAGPFAPTDGVFVFTPEGDDSPAGTWQEVRASDGKPCGQGEACLKLTASRAAGAAVSYGNRIHLMGGVVPFENSPDPVNQSIRTILAAVGHRVFSFGGEFIASNISGTLHASQVFDVRTRWWSRLETTVQTTPLDATGADAKHGTYGVTIVEDGVHKIMAPGGAATAWFDPMSKVHVFTPPAE